jgi:MFS family permease
MRPGQMDRPAEGKGRIVSQPWIMLTVLFAARTSMAFQFQSVAALSPLVADRFGVGLADIGLLIGLYLAPGIVVAGPGSALALKVGEVRLVVVALLSMLAGGLLAMTTDDWTVMIVARVLAGAGGVLVNVILTKFVVDWFTGRGLSTALAVFITSWPAGIALASLALPLAATWGGLAVAQGIVAGLVAVCLLAFVVLYRPPPAGVGAGDAAGAEAGVASPLPWVPIVLAGLIWALYTAGLAMVFSFSPAWLTGEGWSLAAAGALTGSLMAVYSVMLPLGGAVADRTGARDGIIAVSFTGFVVLMPLAIVAGGSVAVVPALLLLGGVFGLAAGPVMTLPGSVLDARNRTLGMGLFWTIYYVVMVIAPRVAGDLSDRSGSSAAALWLGVGLILVAALCLVGFRRAVSARG